VKSIISCKDENRDEARGPAEVVGVGDWRTGTWLPAVTTVRSHPGGRRRREQGGGGADELTMLY
jgi:hypothetical protein